MIDEGLTPSTQVAPLRHGLGAHSSMSTSQFVPLAQKNDQKGLYHIGLHWKEGDLGGDGHDRPHDLLAGGGS